MNKIFTVITAVVLLSSCYSTKKVTYLQSDQNVLEVQNNPQIYLIQPNDILNIRVQSLDPEQSAFFNISAQGTGSATGQLPGACPPGVRRPHRGLPRALSLCDRSTRRGPHQAPNLWKPRR